MIFLLGAARSGWRRGLVFFLIDLVGFVGSVIAAIRFHEIPKTIFTAIGISDRWSALVGGLVIFVPLIVLTAIVGNRAAKAIYTPGLFTLNRVLGAAMAALLAAVAVVVGMLFLRAAPIPFGIGDLVKRSTIAPAAIAAAEPAVGALDRSLGLDLCGGRLKRIIPEACKRR